MALDFGPHMKGILFAGFIIVIFVYFILSMILRPFSFPVIKMFLIDRKSVV